MPLPNQEATAVVLCIGPGRPPVDVQLREKFRDPCIAGVVRENVQHHTFLPLTRESCEFLEGYLRADFVAWRKYCPRDGDDEGTRGPCDRFRDEKCRLSRRRVASARHE